MYENYKPENITSTDKTMALFSHLSIFIFSIFMPAILFVAYKQKSRFVAFNALQAMYYQILTQLLLIVLGGFIVLLIFAVGLDFDAFNSKPMSPDWILVYSITVGSIGIFLIIEYGYAILMALRSGRGNIVKYFLVGEWAYKQIYEKPLQRSNYTERKDDRYSDIYSRDSNPFD